MNIVSNNKEKSSTVTEDGKSLKTINSKAIRTLNKQDPYVNQHMRQLVENRASSSTLYSSTVHTDEINPMLKSFKTQICKEVDLISLPAFVVTEDAIIQHCNYSLSNTFGFLQSELIGANVNLLVDKNTKKIHNTYVQNFFRQDNNFVLHRMLKGRLKNDNLRKFEFKIILRKTQNEQFEYNYALTYVRQLEEGNVFQDQWLLINHSGEGYTRYYYAMLGFYVYLVFMLPCHLFYPQATSPALALLNAVVFLVHLWVNFNLTYTDSEEGYFVYEHTQIVANYLNTMFAVDFPLTVVWLVEPALFGYNYSEKDAALLGGWKWVLAACKYLVLVKLWRVYEHYCTKKQELLNGQVRFNLQTNALLKFYSHWIVICAQVVFQLALVHFLSLLLYYHNRHSEYTLNFGSSSAHSLKKQALGIDVNLLDYYLAVVKTLYLMKPLESQNPFEHAFMQTTMLLGFILLCWNLAAILRGYSPDEGWTQHYADRILETLKWLKDSDISPQLLHETEAQLQQTYVRNRDKSIKQLKYALSHGVYHKLQQEYYSNVIANFRLFSFLDYEIIEVLVLNMTSRNRPKVFAMSSSFEEVFMVIKGKISCYDVKNIVSEEFWENELVCPELIETYLEVIVHGQVDQQKKYFGNDNGSSRISRNRSHSYSDCSSSRSSSSNRSSMYSDNLSNPFHVTNTNTESKKVHNSDSKGDTDLHVRSKSPQLHSRSEFALNQQTLQGQANGRELPDKDRENLHSNEGSRSSQTGSFKHPASLKPSSRLTSSSRSSKRSLVFNKYLYYGRATENTEYYVLHKEVIKGLVLKYPHVKKVIYDYNRSIYNTVSEDHYSKIKLKEFEHSPALGLVIFRDFSIYRANQAFLKAYQLDVVGNKTALDQILFNHNGTSINSVEQLENGLYLLYTNDKYVRVKLTVEQNNIYHEINVVNNYKPFKVKRNANLYFLSLFEDTSQEVFKNEQRTIGNFKLVDNQKDKDKEKVFTREPAKTKDKYSAQVHDTEGQQQGSKEHDRFTGVNRTKHLNKNVNKLEANGVPYSNTDVLPHLDSGQKEKPTVNPTDSSKHPVTKTLDSREFKDNHHTQPILKAISHSSMPENDLHVYIESDMEPTPHKNKPATSKDRRRSTDPHKSREKSSVLKSEGNKLRRSPKRNQEVDCQRQSVSLDKERDLLQISSSIHMRERVKSISSRKNRKSKNSKNSESYENINNGMNDEHIYDEY